VGVFTVFATCIVINTASPISLHHRYTHASCIDDLVLTQSLIPDASALDLLRYVGDRSVEMYPSKDSKELIAFRDFEDAVMLSRLPLKDFPRISSYMMELDSVAEYSVKVVEW
jgi:hypothetical protein